MTPRPRVVVTGMGVVSAAGCRLDAFWDHLVAGRSAVHPITRFDASGHPSRIAAEVDDRDLPDAGASWRLRGRIARYAAVAMAQAIADASLPPGVPDASRGGLVLAAGLGTYGHHEIFGPCAAAMAARPDRFDWDAFARALRGSLEPLAADRRTPGSLVAALAREHGLDGPVMSVMTACAGGTQAVGDALRWIRLGQADVVVAGGSDSEIYPMGLASFSLLGALSTRNDCPEAASRPFDRLRDGFVMGEGAGMLVLEERQHALRRGARIYAEVAGFGSACDAYRVTEPDPEGRGAARAMQRALDTAGLAHRDVAYVNAHGTSTVANDRAETRAIRQVFGSHAARLAVSSTKSMIGHATLASGAIEAIATVLTLVHQVVHPTINLDHPDPACDLDYVPNTARATAVGAALSNSFAFGGQCASLAFRRA